MAPRGQGYLVSAMQEALRKSAADIEAMAKSMGPVSRAMASAPDDLGKFGTILESPDGRFRYMLVAYKGNLIGSLPLSGPNGVEREVEWGPAEGLRIVERV